MRPGDLPDDTHITILNNHDKILLLLYQTNVLTYGKIGEVAEHKLTLHVVTFVLPLWA